MHLAESKSHLGRVLVVDDDPDMRKACSRLLAHEGWTVRAAEHGRQAITIVDAERDQFDCVVSDVNMPELDGFGLIAEIRGRDPDLPVLLMTGDPSLDGAVRALDTGAVSYLAKPFDQETLAGAVARAARRHGVARMRRRAESFARHLAELGGDDRDRLERHFQRALDRSWMAFQPIVHVPSRTVFAYEALIRTDDETLRRPDVLIATAERLERIHELGRVVRAHIAAAAPRIPAAALLFVNVHGLELADEQLYDPSLPFTQLAHRVVLEITERVGVDAINGAQGAAMLRKLGFQIAIDDLGAGYAALGALATITPEIVKLDMSLVRDLHLHAPKQRIVGAIATLVRELGGRVVAEGVETESELEAVLDAGVELIQGYLFGKPMREASDPSWPS